MTFSSTWLALFLGVTVIISGLGVVYAKYASRKHFVALEVLRAERDALDVHWGRLQLELSTLATPGRVESKARQQLGMSIPEADAIVLTRD